MMTRKTRLAALALCLSLTIPLTACGRDTGEPAETAETTPGVAAPEVSAVAAADLPDTVTVVCDGLTGQYDPRYAESDGDLAVARLTGATLLTVDAGGGFVYNAASAGMVTAPADVSVESSDGTAVYTIRLRDDVSMTADALEALYLQLLDADYTGPRTVAQAPIAGLDAYRSGVSANDAATFGAEFDTARDESLYAAVLEQAWRNALAEITDEAVQAARTQPVDTFGLSAYDSDEAVALAMALRGFGEIDSSGTMVGLATGATWTLSGSDWPDADDFYRECAACYLDDAAAFAAVELDDETALDTAARALYIAARAAEAGEGVSTVSGIQVVDDRTLTITVDSADLREVYHVCDVILPDIGPYLLLPSASAVAEQSGDTVILRARDDYFGGTAAIGTVYLQSDGTGDINAAADGSGDTAVSVSLAQFGYIGLNAATVRVGDDGTSASSVALRQALAGMLAVFRERTVSVYFNGDATVLQVPTAADSWTAPDDWTYPTDSDSALVQAKTLLTEAGYTWDEDAQQFTAAPDGASLTFTLLIPANGTGDHPAATLAKQAAALFGSLGLELDVEDVRSDRFWQTVASGEAQLWAAAWTDDSTTDPSRWTTFCGLDSTYSALCQTALETGTASAYGTVYDYLQQQQVVLPFYQKQTTVWFSDSLSVFPDSLTPDYDWVRWLTDVAVNAN
jgi:peptide/nickel transport system substrate-binding protein